MKYCEECKVNVNERHTHCPLCGSHLEKTGESEMYSQIEKLTDYPELQLKNDEYRNFLRRKAAWLLISVTVVCVIINMLLTKESLWSGYVAAAGFMCYFGVITAIYRHRRFYAMIGVFGVVLPLTASFMEMIYNWDTAGDLSGFRYSMEFIVPGILIALIILTNVMVFTDKARNKYYLVTLGVLTLLSLIPQGAVWIFDLPYRDWLSFALFFFALLDYAVILILKWRTVAAEFKKKFFV